MGWLYRLVGSFYGLPDEKIKGCDLVIAMNYGLTKSDTLPDEAVLDAAAGVANRFKVPILWSSTDLFGRDLKKRQDKLKAAYLKEITNAKFYVGGRSSNSIEELRKDRQIIADKKLLHERIVIVCDWVHARRIRLIAHRLFSCSEISIRSVSGVKFNPDHRCILARSEGLWTVANLAHFAGLKILPWGWMTRLRHPVSK